MEILQTHISKTRCGAPGGHRPLLEREAMAPLITHPTMRLVMNGAVGRTLGQRLKAVADLPIYIFCNTVFTIFSQPVEFRSCGCKGKLYSLDVIKSPNFPQYGFIKSKYLVSAH